MDYLAGNVQLVIAIFVQNILLFDKKVLENDNGLFSKDDLIFLENSFDQKLKQQIMQ